MFPTFMSDVCDVFNVRLEKSVWGKTAILPDFNTQNIIVKLWHFKLILF